MSLEPGVYAATVRGVPDVTVMITDCKGIGWTDELIHNEWRHHLASDITGARPLTVLDLGNGIDFSRTLRNVAMHGYARQTLNYLADQIDAHRPHWSPRIPEPGLYGVVETCIDKSTREWIRRKDGWSCPGYAEMRWDNLINPVLIRDGIKS